MKDLARTDSKAVVSACIAVDGMFELWVVTLSVFARRLVHVFGVCSCFLLVFLITAYQC